MTTASRLDATFSALADPTRRALLARLALGEASVLELAEPFAMSQPAISKHLKVLERAGLISRGRQAQRRPCRLEARPLAEATHWLEEFRRNSEESFRRLDDLLDKAGRELDEGKRRELLRQAQMRALENYTFVGTVHYVSLTAFQPEARGMRLDIPAGTAVRFEPGQTRQVNLVSFAGKREVYGFRADVMGKL